MADTQFADEEEYKEYLRWKRKQEQIAQEQARAAAEPRAPVPEWATPPEMRPAPVPVAQLPPRYANTPYRAPMGVGIPPPLPPPEPTPELPPRPPVDWGAAAQIPEMVGPPLADPLSRVSMPIPQPTETIPLPRTADTRTSIDPGAMDRSKPTSLGQLSVRPNSPVDVAFRGLDWVNQNIAEPLTGVATRANAPNEQGIREFPPVRFVEDIAGGLTSGDPGEWWKKRGEYARQERESGRPVVPLGDVPFLVMPGQAIRAAKALPGELRAIPRIAGEAVKDYGTAAKAVNAAVTSPRGQAIAGRLIPGGTVTSTTPGTQKIFDMYYGKAPRAPIDIKAVADKAWTELVRLTTDDNVILSKIGEKAARIVGRPLTADENLYLLKRFEPNVAAEVKISEGLEKAYEMVGHKDLPWLSAYTTALHDKDVLRVKGNAARRFSGARNAQDIDDTLNNMATEIGPARMASVQQASQEVDNAVEAVRQRLLNSEVWDQQLYADLTGKYSHYVPTRILEYQQEAGRVATGSALSLKDRALRNLTDAGTERWREDPLNAVVRFVQQGERMAAQNDRFRALHALSQLDPNLPVRVLGKNDHLLNHETLVEGYLQGVKTRLAADKALKINLTDDNIIRVPLLTTFLNTWKQLQTSRNPLFLMNNAAMDAYTAMVTGTIREVGPLNLRSPANIAKSIAAPIYLPKVISEMGKAWFDVFQGVLANKYKGPGTARFLKSGMGMFGMSSIAPAEVRTATSTRGLLSGAKEVMRDQYGVAGDLSRKHVFEINSKRDLIRLAKDALTLEPVARLSERIELAPRVAQMRLAEKRGLAGAAAGHEGATITIDFRQAGSLARLVNTIVPFFNPNLQAMFQSARAAKRNPVAFVSTLTTMVAVPTLAAEAWNRADPQRAQDYADVPDKDKGLVIMLPAEAGVDAQGNRRPPYWLIPGRDYMPFIIATREAASRAVGEDGRGWQELLAATTQSVSPVRLETPETAVGSFVVPGLATAVQLQQDRDWYTGNRINTERKNINASALAQSATSILPGEVSPSQVDYALMQLGGGHARIARGASNIIAGKEPGQALSDTPVVGGAIGRWIRSGIGANLEGAQERILRDDLRDMLREQGVKITVSPVGYRIDNVPLTMDEQAAYQVDANARIDREVERLIGTAKFSRADVTSKETMVRDAVNQAKSDAADRIRRSSVGWSSRKRAAREAR